MSFQLTVGITKFGETFDGDTIDCSRLLELRGWCWGFSVWINDVGTQHTTFLLHSRARWWGIPATIGRAWRAIVRRGGEDTPADPEAVLAEQVSEYANAVGLYGVGSIEAQCVRASYDDDPEFAEMADSLDRIRARAAQA